MSKQRFVMEFERPLMELEAKLDELRKLDVAANTDLAEEIDDLALADRAAARRHVPPPLAVGPGPDIAPSRPPQDPALRRGALHRRHRVARRPALRRRRGDPCRARDHRRTPRRGARTPQGHRHQGEHPAQLRQPSPRGVPQGDARFRPRREVRPAGRELPRHRRRVAGHRGRGARAGVGDRRVARQALGAACAGRRRRHRRGRQRRCARDRLRRPPADARERVLLGDQPRDVRSDPLPRLRRRPRRPRRVCA